MEEPKYKSRTHEFLSNNIAQLKADNQHLSNVLAIIHWDGGQYISEHGYEKAAQDAIKIICEMRNENEQLKEERDLAFQEIDILCRKYEKLCGGREQ